MLGEYHILGWFLGQFSHWELKVFTLNDDPPCEPTRYHMCIKLIFVKVTKGPSGFDFQASSKSYDKKTQKLSV